jgi:NTE family protein
MTVEAETAKRILVLQGGGALGSYQAGVFEALADGGIEPQWIAGISIGAVNAALIAGNPPEKRVDRLREFWEAASNGPQLGVLCDEGPIRALTSQANALTALMFGVAGFFTPRFPPPPLQPPGTLSAISYYDTAPLKATLERLVDFDLINAGDIRLSVGAVNIRTGNFAYFDNHRETIRPEHIMASGALPPGLPPIEIDGEFYWDGGLVSNTPLEYVLDEDPQEDLLVFQVDLFPSRGPMPRTLIEVDERAKDIRFSSRTRLGTAQAMRVHEAKQLVRDLLDSLPPEIAAGDAARRVRDLAQEHALTVVQLIYRRKAHENTSKDYEFSRATMLGHWASGVEAVRRNLRERDAILGQSRSGDTRVFDLERPLEEEKLS